MGGDKGLIGKESGGKVINVSTLSSIVVASLGIHAMKHGSYANTSPAGSTDTIQSLGVNIFQGSIQDFRSVYDNTNFCFTDAHVCKTIHDLSHSKFLRYETVNHIIGPMTPPIHRETLLHKIIGVNEAIHPTVVAKAYQILHDKGYQNIGNVFVVSGLRNDFDPDIDFRDHTLLKKYMILDEISPYRTLLAIVRNGQYAGDVLMSPDDFGIKLDADSLIAPSDRVALDKRNADALSGEGAANSDYLALNSALAYFAVRYLGEEDSVVNGALNRSYATLSFSNCQNAIRSHTTAEHLEKIRHESMKTTYDPK
jgi:anthranilate phosphoribosyltransferase